MSILTDGVFSSISYFGRGDFQFDQISYEHKMLLKSISKRQRARFKKFGTVPKQLLILFWELGYVPGDEAPQEGMRIQALLELLDRGPYQNRTHQLRCSWFYETIVKEELMSHPKWLRSSKERFVGSGRNRIPLSEVRKKAGTIFRN
jgi:hypothetical protein